MICDFIFINDDVHNILTRPFNPEYCLYSKWLSDKVYCVLKNIIYIKLK